jgi:hypothetical protein
MTVHDHIDLVDLALDSGGLEYDLDQKQQVSVKKKRQRQSFDEHN